MNGRVLVLEDDRHFRSLVEGVEREESGVAATDAASIEAELASQFECYAGGLPWQIDGVIRSIRCARDNPLNEVVLEQALTFVHRLCGSSGSYGYSDVHASLSVVEACMRRFSTHPNLATKEIWALLLHTLESTRSQLLLAADLSSDRDESSH